LREGDLTNRFGVLRDHGSCLLAGGHGLQRCSIESAPFVVSGYQIWPWDPTLESPLKARLASVRVEQLDPYVLDSRVISFSGRNREFKAGHIFRAPHEGQVAEWRRYMGMSITCRNAQEGASDAGGLLPVLDPGHPAIR
jgi:hypothetical protein